MSAHSTAANLLTHSLPHAIPEHANSRLFLLSVRRLGAYGLGDAHLANHFITAFGPAFRRPLILMRVMMSEIAAAASTPMTIAPCCCMRMTASEATLVDIMRRIDHQPMTAHALLADLLGNRRVDGVLATMATVASAFADLGHPVDQIVA